MSRFWWMRRWRWRRWQAPFLLQFTLCKNEVQVPDYIDEKAAHYPDLFLIQAFGKCHGKGCGEIGKLFRGAIIHHPKPPHNIVCGILESSNTTKAAPPVKTRGAALLDLFLKIYTDNCIRCFNRKSFASAAAAFQIADCIGRSRVNRVLIFPAENRTRNQCVLCL